MSSTGETPVWTIGAAVVVGLLLVVGIWYRFLGPGSQPPRPTQVVAPYDDGISPKLRVPRPPGQ